MGYIRGISFQTPNGPLLRPLSCFGSTHSLNGDPRSRGPLGASDIMVLSQTISQIYSRMAVLLPDGLLLSTWTSKVRKMMARTKMKYKIISYNTIPYRIT